MPGTVQVSILELKELPSSSSSSSMSVKVSLGKNTYEADGQKGDFLFPLATFRDNLVVKVHDNKGNEIAHTGVKSRLIAEKGYWDNEFPLEGGGQIHMKLRFSLSEDERNRIRNMRESALRKKKEELLNKQMIVAVASSGGGNEKPSTAAIDLSLEASSKLLTYKASSIPLDTFSYSLMEKPPQEKTLARLKEDEQHYSLKKQILLDKMPPDLPYKAKEQNLVENNLTRLDEDVKILDFKDQGDKGEGDTQPSSVIEESKMENTTSKLQEADQANSSKEQSKMEVTSSNVEEDNLKDQSSLEKTPSTLKEDGEPVNFKDQSVLEETPSRLEEDDQPSKIKEQSPVEKPSEFQEDDQPYSAKEQSKLHEDDQRCNLKDQIPLEKTPSKPQEDDQPYNMKVQSQLENTVSKLQEDDQPDKCKEQSPLEEEPSKVKDDDQRYNLKKPSLLEAAPSQTNKDDQRYNREEGIQLETITTEVKDNLKKPTPLEAKHSKAKENDRRYKKQAEKTSSRIWETIAAFESSPLTKGRTNTAKEQSSREQTASIPDESQPIETKYVDNVEYKSKVEKEKIPLHNIDQSRENSKELRRPSGLEETEPSISGSIRQCSCKNFHGWIFLEEAICTCIVGDNRMAIDLHEDRIVYPETCSGKIVDEEITSSEENKLPGVPKKPDSGPNGQIMKIVLMVGFGLLVLFTRSQKSR